MLALKLERMHLAAAGLDYAPEEFSECFMGLAQPAFRAALMADSLQRLGAGLPDSFFAQLGAAKRHALETRLQAVPGARQAAAAWAGMKAVASSSPREELLAKLQRTGLRALFEPHIYSAEQVARGKPAPDVFLFAADRLAAAANTCLVIEDSVNGVLAACAAGMRVWGFIGGAHADQALGRRLAEVGAGRIIAHHEALIAALAEDQV